MKGQIIKVRMRCGILNSQAVLAGRTESTSLTALSFLREIRSIHTFSSTDTENNLEPQITLGLL